MTRWLRARVLKHPLTRFALVGSLLFGLFGGGPAEPARHAPLSPGASDDEILFGEALARDYHRSDAIVRRRLARNLRFARAEQLSAAQAPSEAALVEESIALGMHETDRVVRRRLVQKMKLAISARARAREPSDQEIQAYLDAHREHFTQPPRARISQRFYRSPERAAAALARPAQGGPLSGDALPLPRDLPWLSRSELARQFGPGFAEAVWALPEARWSGPVLSPYGAHLVRVHGRRPAVASPLPAVRSAVREAIFAERSARTLEQTLAELRARQQRPRVDPS